MFKPHNSKSPLAAVAVDHLPGPTSRLSSFAHKSKFGHIRACGGGLSLTNAGLYMANQKQSGTEKKIQSSRAAKCWNHGLLQCLKARSSEPTSTRQVENKVCGEYIQAGRYTPYPKALTSEVGLPYSFRGPTVGASPLTRGVYLPSLARSLLKAYSAANRASPADLDLIL